MTSREKVLRVLNREGCEDVMWTGHPSDGAVDIFAREWGIVPTREAIYEHLDDDCRWVRADAGSYRHPDGDAMFNTAWRTERRTLSAEGAFAHAETIADLDEYPWPCAAYLDFTDVYRAIDGYQDKMVFTGMFSPFYHIAADFFGMENFFIKMYECPEVVRAVIDRITDFFVEGNTAFFAGLGSRADVMFFGNDFGTQLDLMISPEAFRAFILPAQKRLIDVGKRFGKKVMLHSCGSIARVIPDLIGAGVDILHPIQAQAAGMSAGELAQYKDKLSFVGGLDAQSFFVNATPAEIAAETARVRRILGPGIVISPSHEEILPNIPAANVLAMARAKGML